MAFLHVPWHIAPSSELGRTVIEQRRLEQQILPQQTRLAMPIPIPDGRIALQKVLVEYGRGTEHLLFERDGRHGHFAHELRHGEYTINLRLDWKDIAEGEPTLDVDIYCSAPDGARKRVANGEWHHNRLVTNAPDDVRRYEFKFRDLTLQFIACESLASIVSLDGFIDGPDSSAKTP